jgi:flagellar FliL protein
MTDQALNDDTNLEGEETEELSPRKRWNGKRIILFIVLPAMLVLGGGAAVWFSGLLDFGGAEEEVVVEEDSAAAPESAVFFELPDLLVNLNTAGRRTSFLKIKVSLEVTCWSISTPRAGGRVS